MIDPIDPQADSPEEESPKPKKNGVLVQKHKPTSLGVREKLCATCGKPFTLTPEEKFFDCPACHKKANPVHKSPKKAGAQILIQIKCVGCGNQDFLEFIPPNPKQAYCRTCFSKQKREQKARLQHKTSR